MWVFLLSVILLVTAETNEGWKLGHHTKARSTEQIGEDGFSLVGLAYYMYLRFSCINISSEFNNACLVLPLCVCIHWLNRQSHKTPFGYTCELELQVHFLCFHSTWSYRLSHQVVWVYLWKWVFNVNLTYKKQRQRKVLRKVTWGRLKQAWIINLSFPLCMLHTVVPYFPPLPHTLLSNHSVLPGNNNNLAWDDANILCKYWLQASFICVD